MIEIVESKLLKEFSGIKHGFFTRKGGVSSGIYESLNFGFGSSDDPEKIRQNYELAADFIGVPVERIVTVRQVHSNICVEFDETKEIKPKYYEGDALLTKQKNLVLCSLTADCVPLLIYAKDIEYVAAIHAGWKGAFTGIIQNTVAQLLDKGAKKENLNVAVMPAISQDSYEVDENFYQNFLKQSDANQKYFQANDKQKYQFDLRGYELDILEDLGITNVDNIDIDTYKNEDICYSYRLATHKGETDMGRHISFICIK